MQSLQMRCPVPAHIGLSTVMTARGEMTCPRLLSSWNSLMRSSSGQPSISRPSGLTLMAPAGSRRPRLQLSLPWCWQ
jgi:hypothetical protein